MLDLTREGQIFTLTMDAGENRWNTTFVHEFDKLLDEVEESEGPAALITRSADEKFFSNGLDLEWAGAPDGFPERGDRAVFGEEFMILMGRIITLPIPTVCAINGHAFGAGFMLALCHDVRIQRRDRGFLCANEMQIGIRIPTPEVALFRHKIPMSAFFETVQLSRRWTAPDALQAGIVNQVVDIDDLMAAAQTRAEALAPLSANRELFGELKERLYGKNAVINGPDGAAHMLKNPGDYN